MAVMCSPCPNGRRRFLAGAGLTFCLGNVLDWTAALLCVGRYQWSAGPARADSRRSTRQPARRQTLSRLKSGTMLLADRGYDALFGSMAHERISHQKEIGQRPCA